jgi:nicotinamide-nucleotide amidase
MTDPLAQQVVNTLARLGRTLAVAESCTGGMVCEAITSVPGSSAVLLGGVVAYANDVKSAQLGVDARLIESHGAVSAEVAGAMAQGVRIRLGADVGVSTTGIAGPDGGTADKPVGLVFIGLQDHHGHDVFRLQLGGTREDIRRSATERLLSLLLERITRRPS